MLINCPRCGFSQPQDQYCAQCGVDMQSYKPKEAPFFQRLFGNVIFQVIVLLVVIGFVGQHFLRNNSQQKFAQRMMRAQGITRSESSTHNDNETPEEIEKDKRLAAAREAQVSVGSVQSPDTNSFDSANTNGANGTPGNAGVSSTAARNAGDNPAALTLKLSFIEVSTEVLGRWIQDSSNSGLYQSLPEYSVGILPDFRKRNDTFTNLKSSDVKILVGSSNTTLAGPLSDDGTHIIGLSVAIDLRSAENETLLGNITVTKQSSSRQPPEIYPSEFNLVKGSAFFLVGSLKVENFLQDRAKMPMPPFQVFKSPDFMTRKTEFVIILEPVYK
ncbi:MAG: hypothetical protein ACXWQQ_12395 [Pseudobdellovibrio sp.]